MKRCPSCGDYLEEGDFTTDSGIDGTMWVCTTCDYGEDNLPEPLEVSDATET